MTINSKTTIEGMDKIVENFVHEDLISRKKFVVSKIWYVFVFFFFVLSCSNNGDKNSKNVEKVYKKIAKNIWGPDKVVGSGHQSGSITGRAVISVQPEYISVSYSAMGYNSRADGKLSEFKILRGCGFSNCNNYLPYALSARWEPETEAGGRLNISVTNENIVEVYIFGDGNWKHWKEIDMQDDLTVQNLIKEAYLLNNPLYEGLKKEDSIFKKEALIVKTDYIKWFEDNERIFFNDSIFMPRDVLDIQLLDEKTNDNLIKEQAFLKDKDEEHVQILDELEYYIQNLGISIFNNFVQDYELDYNNYSEFLYLKINKEKAKEILNVLDCLDGTKMPTEDQVDKFPAITQYFTYLKMPTQDQVDKFFALTENETHYLKSKPIAGKEGTLNSAKLEPWNEFDLSNFNKFVRETEAKINLNNPLTETEDEEIEDEEIEDALPRNIHRISLDESNNNPSGNTGVFDEETEKWIKLFSFKDGYLQGEFLEFYPNEQIKVRGWYSNGLKDGYWKFFHENGQLWQELDYEDGEIRDGTYTWYEPSGAFAGRDVYKEGKQITIGSRYGGGYVFGLDEDGGGWIVADIDFISTDYQSAIEICNNSNYEGFSDWYLPSREQLEGIQKTVGFGATGVNNNIGNFKYGFYWSSTYVTGSDSKAWKVLFYNSGRIYWTVDEKDSKYPVRAIRKF